MPGDRERVDVLAQVGLRAGQVTAGPVGELPAVRPELGGQVRAPGDAVPARASVRDGAVQIALDIPGALRGVAPGQSAVLYDGTRVLGQATVTAALRSPGATSGLVR